jgi:thiamine monophosphate synthase
LKKPRARSSKACVQMLQYRDKTASGRDFEDRARRLLEICRAEEFR